LSFPPCANAIGCSTLVSPSAAALRQKKHAPPCAKVVVRRVLLAWAFNARAESPPRRGDEGTAGSEARWRRSARARGWTSQDTQ
jgi:hypothetical protein